MLLSIHAYLTAKVDGEFKLSYMAAGPTELRVLLIGLTLTMLILGPKPGLFAPVSGFDLFVGAVATLLGTLFALQTWKIGRRLASINE